MIPELLEVGGLNKILRVILIIVCIAAVALCCAIPTGGLPDNGNPSEAAQIAPTAAAPTPEPTPEPESKPVAEQVAEPMPVSIPEPLNIAKQELPFAELAPTVAMSFAELVGDNGVYEDETEIPPLPSPDTYKLVVNIYWQFAAVYSRDQNGEYTIPVRYMVVTTGAYKTPTPRGTFKMGDHYVRYGLFSCGVYGQYWRQITRSFYTHSLLYIHRNANTYTSSYSLLGKRGSHGCVRMMVPDARWIYYNIAPGTTCEIIKGDKHDEAAAAIKTQLLFPKKPRSRPGLKAGKIPVTEAWPGWQGNAYAAYQGYLASLETETEAASG
jgi:lipoprotein-anchoring transpeptidase ErfK/SrfK